ncbi:MAG TPA: DUF4350 domain-containing protein [Burkholderiales bacterium]
MSRVQVLVGVLLLAVIAAGAAWFFRNFEEVTETVHTGYRGPALRNPFLAAERLLLRLGAKASTLRSIPELRTLPAPATLVLPARRTILSQSLQLDILEWVANGGYLIVEAEPPGQSDPLLEALRVQRHAVRRPRGSKDSNEPVEVRLPGSDSASRVQLSRRMRLEAPAAEYHFDDGSGKALLLVEHGNGLVMVLNELEFAFNPSIGEEQHAQFLWQMVSIVPDDRPVLLFSNAGRLSLGDWLQENAWAPLAGGAVLLLLWLWSVAPRLGPIAPDPARNRRRLLDHLRASGRFLWSSGGAQRMLDAARDSCLRRIARAHPDFLAISDAERPRWLAEILGWPEPRVRQLLAPANAAKMMDFLQAIGLYQAVHEQLALKARVPSRKTR